MNRAYPKQYCLPKAILILLFAASYVTATVPISVGYCQTLAPIWKDDCSVEVVCYEDIATVNIPQRCRFSTNYDVDIDLTLISTTTVDNIDWDHVGDILRRIANFKLKSSEQIPNLNFVNDMVYLKNFKLDGYQVVKIPGTPFSDLTNLEQIDLSSNSLTEVDGLFEFNIVPQVLYLSLAYNQINELADDTFSQLIRLTHLDLSHNNIKYLTECHLKNLMCLEYLNLSNNKMTNLDCVVKELVSLKYLYANNNELYYLDPEFDNISYHLAELDLSGNRIKNINNDIFLRLHYFEGFCKILLSSNQITLIPNADSEIAEIFTQDINENEDAVLIGIDLSNNSISLIEYGAFEYVANVMSLNLAINKLKTFTVNPEHLKKVEVLNLSNNEIIYLDPLTIKHMNNLQILDVSDNMLFYNLIYPFYMYGFFNTLNLSCNYFDDLRHLYIRNFQPGGILDLSYNRLSSILLERTHAENLRELILNSNNIEDASLINLYELDDLKRLEIKNNYIQMLNTPLELPSNLDVLDLSDNEIEDIVPSSFDLVKNLKELYLRNNRLTMIRYGSFQGLRYLTTIDLSDNNIAYLDSVVLMDLVSLQNLYLKYTGIYYIDYGQWLSHKFTIYVHLDGNEYSCDELSKALKDYNNNFSKMKLTVSGAVSNQPTLHGIPCKLNEGHAITSSNRVDERLLMINKQILEAIQSQKYIQYLPIV